jgi:hypothetical protein
MALGERARGLLAAICLVAFGSWAGARYDWQRLPRYVEGSLTGRGRSSAAERATGSGFWFDRGYPAFLEAIRAATPPGVSVAVSVPERPPAYFYQAEFTLAPRRVVTLKDAASSEYVAWYRSEADVPGRSSMRIPGGVLVRR